MNQYPKSMVLGRLRKEAGVGLSPTIYLITSREQSISYSDARNESPGSQSPRAQPARVRLLSGQSQRASPSPCPHNHIDSLFPSPRFILARDAGEDVGEMQP